jgi:hypothetical protein
MKVIIAGSRSIEDYALVCEVVSLSRYHITELVSGRCKLGVDALGERWAKRNDVPIKAFPAIWRDRFGTKDSAAGFKRNYEMSLYADALIAVWDGKSNGTKNMIECMQRAKKPHYVYNQLKPYEHLFAGC